MQMAAGATEVDGMTLDEHSEGGKKAFDGSPKEQHQRLKQERKRGMTETGEIRRNHEMGLT